MVPEGLKRLVIRASGGSGNMPRCIDGAAVSIMLLAGLVAIACGPQPQPPAIEEAEDRKASLVTPDAATVEAPRVYRISGDVVAPVVIKRAEMSYPDVDPDKPYSLGVLVLEGVVNRSGRIQDVRIVRGPDNANSRAVIASLSEWEFRRGTVGGEPVDVMINFTVNHFPTDLSNGE